MAIQERDVWARINEVIDPELDRPLDELGFVNGVEISGGEVSVRLRLPTYWCAPNFTYMMAADLRDRISQAPSVERVTVHVDDHFAGDEISDGVNHGQRFSEVFPGDADGELDDLRRTFAVKAFLIRQEQMLRSLMRAGAPTERLLCLALADLRVDGADVLVEAPGQQAPLRAPGLARIFSLWRSRRAALGLAPPEEGAPCFTTVEGDTITTGKLQEHLRSARMIRLNGVFNTMFCTGMHTVRYGTGQYVEDSLAE